MFSLVCMVIAVMVVVVVAFRRPAAALALVFCQYGFDQLLATSVPFVATHSWIPQVLVAAIVGIALVDTVARDRRLAGPGPWTISLWVFGFILFFLLSFIWSPFDDTLPWLKATLPYVVLMVLAGPLLIRRPEDLGAALWCLVFVGVLLTIAILLSPKAVFYGNRLHLLTVADVGRRTSPLALADLGAILFMAAILLNVSGAVRVISWLRYLAAAAGLVLCALCSRGELLAAVLAVLIMVPASRRISDLRRFAGVAFTVFILLIILFVVREAVMTGEAGERWSPQKVAEGFEDRFVNWAALLGEYVRQPMYWLVGLGANYSHTLLSGIYPHNHPIQALGETGLIGITLWLGIVVVLIRSARQTWPHVRDDAMLRGGYAVLGAFCMYFLAVGLKRGSVLNVNWFMMAVLAGRYSAAVFGQAAELQWYAWFAGQSGEAGYNGDASTDWEAEENDGYAEADGPYAVQPE